jgi:hypothetical protein
VGNPWEKMRSLRANVRACTRNFCQPGDHNPCLVGSLFGRPDDSLYDREGNVRDSSGGGAGATEGIGVMGVVMTDGDGGGCKLARPGVAA